MSEISTCITVAAAVTHQAIDRDEEGLVMGEQGTCSRS